uniref:Uncharacterized protein n=1 Tax=Anguilla anguilla TaxID=7936 RepID=A0A0E9T633_ANGAN
MKYMKYSIFIIMWDLSGV